MRAIRNSLILFVALLCIIAGCDDPTTPPDPLPEFPEMDTTSHEYSWEFISFGRVGPYNGVTSVYAVSDSDIWITGRIPVDEPLINYPTGHPSDYANVIHWDGRKLEYYSIAGKLGDGSIGPYTFRNVMRVDGYIWLMTGMGYTELTEDSVRIVQFESYRESPQYMKSEIGRSGRIYLWDENVGLAYMPSYSSKDFVVVDVQSSDEIRDFTEIGIDDYLLIRYNLPTHTSWIQRITNGQSIVITHPEFDETVTSRAYQLWVGENYFVCEGRYYMLIQSLDDDRMYKVLPHALYYPEEETFGLIVTTSGRAENDVFFGGHYSTVVHFNGISLKRYSELYKHDRLFLPICMSITNNSIALAGHSNIDGKALLVIGRKR